MTNLQEKRVDELTEYVQTKLQSNKSLELLKILRASLPQSYTLLETSKNTVIRTKYKLDIAISLLESEPFEKVKEYWNDQILLAIYIHDAWELDGLISTQISITHAYRASQELKHLAIQKQEDDFYTIANLVESHEGANLQGLKHTHLMCLPETIQQVFVYQVVQSVDRLLIPNLAYALYDAGASDELFETQEYASYKQFKDSLKSLYKD